MQYLFLALTLLIITFGCASISNSYASAKQAEAAIEASQTAQLALGGQIVISILLVLAVIILVFVILTLLYKLLKKQPTGSRQSRHSSSYILQDGIPLSSNLDAQYRHPVSQNETENNFPILPSDWGW